VWRITYVNFGDFKVAGFDYEARYKYLSRFGEFGAAVNATQTYRYRVALTPNVAATDRTNMANADGNWAPRWKGTVTLAWKQGSGSASVDGRWVGPYQDYNLPDRTIGNFWLIDANFRYGIGDTVARGNRWLKDTYVEVGGINLFNNLPEFSNIGVLGYDYAQGDIRGRFFYARVGLKL